MTFDFITTDDGFRIHDQIEDSTLVFGTDSTVTPRSVDPGRFRAPVDAGVQVHLSRLTLQQHLDVLVYADDELVDELTFGVRRTFDGTEFELELRNTACKCYARVFSTDFTIDQRGRSTTIEFQTPTELTLGVRSYHEHPAGVVTTTTDPSDFAAAVSTFGTALKTTTPERAWPTLRGHPPELQFSSTAAIPDELASPDTGVVIETPADISTIATLAPLAYYLAAAVTIGEHTALHAAGTTYRFDEADLACDARELLRHLFCLDCIVRTEGLYEFELRERRRLEARYPLDVAGLYEQPLDERTASYLSIPRAVLDGMLPWPQLAHIHPSPESLTVLPYLVYSLSAIQSPPVATARRNFSTARQAHDSASDGSVPAQQGQPTQGAANVPDGPPSMRSFSMDADLAQTLVEPASNPVRHTAWVGPNFPVQGSAPTLSSYVTGLSNDSATDGISVNLVCNDSTMRQELVDAYGSAELDRLSVTEHVDLTVDELRDLLVTPQHFLHYVGHIDSTGLRCADGVLDVGTLSTSGVEAFLLNGCTSVTQGRELLDLGSVFGIVTTTTIENELATEQGRTLARLLDRGFTAADALSVLSACAQPTEYVVLGNANYSLCPAEDAACFYSIDTTDIRDGAVKVTITALPNTPHTFGGMLTTRLTPSTKFLQGTLDVIATRQTLEDLVETTTTPLFIDGELHWFNEFEPGDLWPYLKTKRE